MSCRYRLNVQARCDMRFLCPFVNSPPVPGYINVARFVRSKGTAAIKSTRELHDFSLLLERRRLGIIHTCIEHRGRAIGSSRFGVARFDRAASSNWQPN
jgi:hypothetical protein